MKAWRFSAAAGFTGLSECSPAKPNAARWRASATRLARRRGVPYGSPRRSKVRSAQNPAALLELPDSSSALPCSSFPNRTHFVGLRFGCFFVLKIGRAFRNKSVRKMWPDLFCMPLRGNKTAFGIAFFTALWYIFCVSILPAQVFSLKAPRAGESFLYERGCSL